MGMNEILLLIAALGAGAALGALFFAGLWWTVNKGVSSRGAALWFSGSLLLRLSLALTGFYLVAGSHWQRLLACVLGFFIARRVATALTQPSGARSPGDRRAPGTREVTHAPQS
jgi:F1F0 ATPase subunit 2